MSDDELDRIRSEKRARLRERLEEGGSTGSTPNEPVQIRSPEHFEEVTGASSAVLVDFYADWCGPCRMLAPTLERLAADVDFPATVAKVDTEALPQIAQRFGVRGLPTLVLFVDGEPAERLVGMQDENRLRRVVERTVEP